MGILIDSVDSRSSFSFMNTRPVAESIEIGHPPSPIMEYCKGPSPPIAETVMTALRFVASLKIV